MEVPKIYRDTCPEEAKVPRMRWQQVFWTRSASTGRQHRGTADDFLPRNVSWEPLAVVVATGFPADVPSNALGTQDSPVLFLGRGDRESN